MLFRAFFILLPALAIWSVLWGRLLVRLDHDIWSLLLRLRTRERRARLREVLQ